jgi:hypothetical protein
MDEPWDAEEERRDWEPHYGGELRFLAAVSLACAVGSFGALVDPPWSFALLPCVLGGLGLGLVSSVLAWEQLMRIADGLTDPHGFGALRCARNWGAGAAYLSLFASGFTLLALLKALHVF